MKQEISDYWSKDEMMFDITTREAFAVDKVLRAFKDLVKDCRVDVMIDNRAVMHAWNNQGGKGRDLNNVIKAFVLYHYGFEHPTTHVVHSVSRESGRRPFSQIVILRLYTRIGNLE